MITSLLDVSEIPIFVINLDVDHARFEEVVRQFPIELRDAVRRVRGVPGSTLPKIACDLLTKTPDYHVGSGALGCFLSHLHAWELIGALDIDFALIIEDDVEIINVDQLLCFKPPIDADLVFCNDRMSVDQESDLGSESFGSIRLAMERLVKTDARAVGTDGYFLSPAAARKLIEATKVDLCYGHVDWRLLRYCSDENLLSEYFEGTLMATVLRTHHHWERPQWGLLRAYVLSKPLVKHIFTGDSRRAREDGSGF